MDTMPGIRSSCACMEMPILGVCCSSQPSCVLSFPCNNRVALSVNLGPQISLTLRSNDLISRSATTTTTTLMKRNCYRMMATKGDPAGEKVREVASEEAVEGMKEVHESAKNLSAKEPSQNSFEELEAKAEEASDEATAEAEKPPESSVVGASVGDGQEEGLKQALLMTPNV